MNEIDKINKGIRNFLESDNALVSAARVILGLAAIGGIVFVGAAAPGILGVFAKNNYHKKFSDKKIRDSFYSLKSRKLIDIIEEGNGKFKVIITAKGRKSIRTFSLDNLAIKKQAKWDRKWRVLMFDIPSTTKQGNAARQALREKIKELGFLKLQKSAWIFPFPCSDEILFVSEMHNVTKYVEILTVENLLDEEYFKKRFGLK